MATNVTEKDKTLNEIIDWAKSRCHEAALSRFDVRRKSDRDFYDGQVNAFHEILELCRSMPSEVPPRVNAILTPDSTGSKLILGHVQSYNDLSYRRRPASEILWAMVKANGKRTN